MSILSPHVPKISHQQRQQITVDFFPPDYKVFFICWHQIKLNNKMSWYKLVTSNFYGLNLSLTKHKKGLNHAGCRLVHKYKTENPFKQVLIHTARILPTMLTLVFWPNPSGTWQVIRLLHPAVKFTSRTGGLGSNAVSCN